MDILGASSYATKFTSKKNQLRDIVRLYLKYQLLPIEYYVFELYKLSNLEKENFIGIVESKKIWERANINSNTRVLINDKLKCEDYLKGRGIPTTTTIAAEKFDKEFPLFCKPRFGNGGKGAYIAYSFEQFPSNEYVAQKFVFSHPVIHRICNSNSLATVRVLTMLEHGKAKVLSAVLKVPQGDSITDNTSNIDNYIISVNVKTGKLTRAFRSPSSYTKGDFKPRNSYSMLPNPSNEYLVINGIQLPFWEETLDVAKKVQELFWDSKLLGLDVAITKDGPVVIEPNARPNLAMMQIADEKGLRDAITV